MPQFGEGKLGRAPELGVRGVFNAMAHSIKYIRSLGGAGRELVRSPRSNFNGRERILVDDEALSFSRLSSD